VTEKEVMEAIDFNYKGYADIEKQIRISGKRNAPPTP